MAKAFEITEQQKTEIKTARKKNRNKNIEKRLYALELRAEGKSLKEISERTGYHAVTVSGIISRYVRNGLEAITGNHYRGNRRNMSYEAEAAILEPFLKRAKEGETVSVKEMAEAYQQALSHQVSNTQIYAVLHRHEWQKRTAHERQSKARRDPAET